MNRETVSNKVGTSTSATGKYMSFKLGAEEYGLEILKVREIIGMLPITRVPNKVAALRGVINLRGRIIPVLDLRLRFGLDAASITDQSVIIVVQYSYGGGELTVGLLVDEVLEVVRLSADQVDTQPEYGTGAASAQFISGIGKLDQRMVFLVNLEKVLTSDEASRLHFKGETS